jgi:CheY-like chemotaxis protein
VAQRDRLRGIYVLLVDDDPDTLDVFGSYIRHYGAHVRGAASGHDALAYLAIARPNVIVTDQMMPGMSGMELLQQVRKMAGDAERPIPVILCSIARLAGV